MTPGEKPAAEWEARHDVAARGAHGSAAGGQDHLPHRREEEHLGRREAHPRAAQPSPSPGPAPAAPSRTPRWWQRLLRRRSR